MNKITIAAVQMDIIWEDYEKNLAKVEKYVNQYTQQADLIVFPEMFLTGFSMNVNHASLSHQHEYIERMQQYAINKKLSIAGSLMIEENEHYFNRFFYFHKDGKINIYNKRHLFRMASEHDFYTAGKEKILVQENNITIMPAVCYDLRFPVWLRNKNDYDVLIVVANWPASRIDFWKKLLAARAIENQSYVIGVNRCGIDGNGIRYSGGTMIVDYKGNIISEARDNSEDSIHAVIDKPQLEQFRKEFPFYLDADDFNILK
jgi:omega-amidase